MIIAPMLYGTKFWSVKVKNVHKKNVDEMRTFKCHIK